MNFKDITGQKFNKLTTIKRVGTNSWGGTMWLFRCDCGNEVTRLKYEIVNGKIKSCGCVRKIMHENGSFRKTHNMSRTRFYRIWYAMQNRCNNTCHKQHKNYGGRGISVLWESFVEFKHDMYSSYLNHCALHGEKRTTIDRVDNDGNYCKENCRWASYKKQGANRRKK